MWHQSKWSFAVWLTVSVGLGASQATAQQLIIYPANGQTPEQQSQDDAECQSWATQNTGIDPVQIAQAGGPQSSSQGGEVVRGTVGGAALGTIGGLIGGDTKKGLAIGAGVGAAGGLFNRMGNNHRDQQNQQNFDAQRQNAMAEWNRARATCLQGRGYTVS